MNYVQIAFSELDNQQTETLIALLADAGFESFEEQDDKLLACIKESDFSEELLSQLIKIAPAKYTKSIIPQQNWNAQWESSFEPIVVGDFAGIRAGFHKPLSRIQHEIIITPKMSFGTGHHATTFMMMQQMEEIDFTGKTAVDYGTGTAVLAILAEKMGAAHVEAIDNDDWSIENAFENIATNRCKQIKLIKAETINSEILFDIVLANINLHVILQNLAVIVRATKTGGIIILSGFIKADEEQLKEKLLAAGVSTKKTLQKGDWISILAAKD